MAESGDVLLASAAQDALIRVWRISAGRRDADAAVAAAASLQSTKGQWNVPLPVSSAGTLFGISPGLTGFLLFGSLNFVGLYWVFTELA